MQKQSELPYLGVRYQIRYHQCNLKCPYCIAAWAEQENLFDIASFNNIIGKIKMLPYRVSLRIGVGGEIFTSSQLMEGVRDICNTPSNIHNVSFSTNLAADWKKLIGPFFSSVDTSRVGVGCTLHDTVIEDIGEFFNKVENIKKMGAEIYAGFVAVPGRFQYILEYKKRCADLNIPLIMNGLVGKLTGTDAAAPPAEYPKDYTLKELSALQEVWDTPHSYKLLVEACETRGMKCSAGKNYIYIDHQGNVFPCEQIKQCLGNILREPIDFRAGDTLCPNTVCWCGNENQALRIVDQYYDRSRTLRIFYPKKDIPYEQLYQGYNSPIYSRK